MIKITKLYKKYGNRVILSKLNLSFPDKGLIAIAGSSGSGKTTLLNAIGAIDNSYEGTISIDKEIISKFSDEEKASFRLKNIGYIFQNLNLLNLETVFTNVKMPLDAISNSNESIKKKRVMDILKYLDIAKLYKKVINKLSGGERQRVAIAKAIVNNPKILLCDEPTGALDIKNSHNIFKILKIISKKSLVLVATHDLETIKEYADQIIEIKDGKITNQTEYEFKPLDEDLLVLANTKLSKKSYLPLGFKILHSYHKIKAKKFRFLITNFMLSLSLTGIGISLIISSSVSSKITSAFSNMLSGNQIIMSERQPRQNIYGGVFSIDENNASAISKKYPDEIEGIGATYLVNFENFFKHKNEVKLNANAYTYKINSLSARSFNDFRWLDNSNKHKVSPNLYRDLKDDEIVLALSYVDMVNICFHLKIQRNYESLATYIYGHFSTIVLHVKNDDWQYEDEQIYEIKGIYQDDKTYLVHSNRLFNKVVFEDNMRFPINDGSGGYYPWEMYRLFYFKTKDDPKVLLDKVLFDDSLYDFAFERTSSSYHPSLCKVGEVCKEKRVIAYYVDKKTIRPSIINNLTSRESLLNDYYFINDLGYASYASSLLSGFSRNVFVSSLEEKIDEAIDADTSSDDVNTLDIKLPDEVVRGNFLDSLGDGVKFSTKMNSLTGEKPKNNNEIVISKGLADKLFYNENPIGNSLYFTADISLSNENTKKDYRKKELKIVGVNNHPKNYIYHNSNWTISFFRDELGAENFYLTPRSVIFELDENVDASKLANKLNKVFHDYSFVNPMSELSESIDTTLGYAQTILFAFSILSASISILLLGTVILLDIMESKDEIRIFEYTGISRKDISSQFVTQSLVQTSIAFLLSIFEIIVVDISVSIALDSMFQSGLDLSINIVPILVVFIVAIGVSYIVSKLMVILLFQNKKKTHKTKHLRTP